MAPSAAAERSSARHRQRSVAELKGDVLSLIRRTRSSLPSDCDGTLYATHHQAFHGVCSSWVVTICASADSARSASSSSTTATEKQQQAARAVSDQLATLTQFVTYRQQHQGFDENRELVGVIVRSISATTEIQRRRRKRKLPTALAVSSLAAAVNGDSGAGTTEALSRVAELVGVWLLHSSGLLRLEDVLLGVASSSPAEPYEWLTVPVHLLLDHTAQKLHLPSLRLPSSTHNVVEALLLYIIRLAFTDSRSTNAPFTSDAPISSRGRKQGFPASHVSDQAAMRALQELCFFTRNGFSIPTLRLVTQILSKRATLLDQQQQQSVTNSGFGRLAVARDRVEAFLQPQIEKLASPYSLMQAAYTHDELEEIFSAYQSCLSTSTFVQIVRQFIYEASGGSTGPDMSPDAAVSRQPKSVIRDALYQLITSLATKRSDFVDHVLTLAHDLASEGVQGMNGFLLRHSLELVAAVSSGAGTIPGSSSSTAAVSSSSAVAVDCYRDWVRDHFAAQDAGARKSLLDIVTSSDAAHNFSAPATPRCLKQRNAACSLVTTKRQIQFLCAFLLEFDRREQPAYHRNADAIPMYPVAKASHVAAHLSVMKTHQPQFPSGGLIMDFCSQTRSRYLELLKIEQVTSVATADSVEVATCAALQHGTKQRVVASVHSAKARNMVREHIQLFRDSKKLSPQLRQWKMFQPQLWKQELIPCCLDIDFDNLWGAACVGGGDGGDRCAAESKLLEHVALVHALAKSGLVTIHEYSQFLLSAEAWLESRQKRRKLKKKSYTRQRHVAAEEGEGLDHALELLEADMAAERNDPSAWGRQKQVSSEILDKLRGALESSFESVVNAAKVGRGGPMQRATATLAKQMLTLWEEGCVKVIRVLGLEQINAFFAYLIPVFGRSAPSTQEDLTDATPSTASQQDKGDEKTTHVLIANFFVSQVSWTEKRVDDMFLYEVSSLAAIVAALLGACGESQSICSMSDIALLIELIDEKCVAGGSSSSVTGLLLHGQLLRRFLFYSTMLRAADTLAPDRQETQPRVLTTLLQCEALKPEIRDFLSWIGHRSMVATGASQMTASKGRQMAVHEDSSVWPFSFVLENLRALPNMRWCGDVFSLKNLTMGQLRKFLTLEFRYGLKLFGEAATSKMGESRQQFSHTTTSVGNPREWLQTELDIIADLGGFQVASIESVSEWIVAEILFQVTAPIASSSDGAGELRSRDDVVALLLLILNDLMHKLSLQQVEPATSNGLTSLAATNQGFASRTHGRILAYYVSSALRMIQANGRMVPVHPRLQHHGFEVLEICARHQIDCRSSKDLAGGDDGTTLSLVELIREIGDHFQNEFPWSLLQALFFYIMRSIYSDSIHKDPNGSAPGVRDLPSAIIVRCAIEYPRLRTGWARRGTKSDLETGSGTQHGFIRHLQWIHEFSRQVVDSTGDDLDAVSTLDRDEFSLLKGMDATKYQTLTLKYLFRWNLVQVPDLTTQAHLVKPFFVEVAKRILRALDAHNNNQKMPELATCFVGEWLGIAFTKAEEEQQAPAGKPRPVDFHFQLFLVHAVAELCKRSAQVAKNLLCSWRNATSSAKTDGSAFFIALLMISMCGGDDDDTTTSTNLFDQVLEMNSSIWVNESPQIALHVLSVGLVSSEPVKTPIETSSSVVKLIKVIANTQSFKERLTLALYKVLRHGVVNQVVMLDASLPRRIRQAWPTLSDIASQLPVVALDGDSRAT